MNSAYVCFCPFHFEVFRAVYERFPGRRPDIVVAPTAFDKDGANVAETIRLLEKSAIPYVVNPTIKYDVILSCHILEKSDIRPISHHGTRYIRILYSTIGKNYTYSEKNSLYDLLLTIGKYSTERMQTYAQCVAVGMPRYDKLFSESYDKQLLRRENGLEGTLPVLVYLPTWSDQCTINAFGNALVDMAREYHVVVKPHPLTYICEREKLDVFKDTPVNLIHEDCPIDQLLAMADLVITDYSSTIFEVAAAGKPLLLFNLVKQTLEASKLYSSNDPEHQYRHIAVSLDQPDKLRQAVDEAIADQEPWPTLRRECAACFFACRDGTSSEKAARAIQQFIFRNRTRIMLGRWQSHLQTGRDRAAAWYDKFRPRVGAGRYLRRLFRR